MTIKEEKLTQVPIIPKDERDMGVTSLNTPDIAELILRARFTRGFNPEGKEPDIRTSGAIVIPRYQVRYHAAIERLVETLEQSGQMSLKERVPKHCSNPEEAGNLVLYPGIDLADRIERITPETILAIASFCWKYPDIINTITVLPNTSPRRKLNGVVVNFNDKRNWWSALARLSWPIFRGLSIFELPIKVEEFIEVSDFFLTTAYQFGRSNLDQGIKYIHFLHEEDGDRMFLTIAAGPNSEEIRGLSHELINLTRASEADTRLKQISNYMRERRTKIIGEFLNACRFNVFGERVFDNPYVSLDIPTATAISGATVGDNGLNPFIEGISAVRLYQDSGKVVPLGTRFYRRKDAYIPQLPPGISLAQIGLETVNSPEFTIMTSQALTSYSFLALGYHQRWDKF